MKTWQVIEVLSKNTELRFKSIKFIDSPRFLSVKGDYLIFERTQQNGEIFSSIHPAGGFNGNVSINDQWELVRQSVDFMTAANSGGKIKPINDSVHNFNKLGYWSMTLENINSKWLIE